MTFHVKATIACAALISFFAAPAVYSLVHSDGPAYAVFESEATGGNAGNEAAPEPGWIAAAPGVIEPVGGLFEVGTAQMGRVSEVFVAPGDPVEQGQLLLKLEDGDVRARLAAALIRAEVQEKVRDEQKLASSRRRLRDAQDEVYHAERARTGARFALDTLLAGRRSGAKAC